MLVIRLVGFIVLVLIGVSFVAYAATREKRYLSFAYTLFKYTLILLLIFALFYVVERVLLVV